VPTSTPLKGGLCMGYTWILDLGMMAVDVYFWWKQRSKESLPRIVGSVPYVPLRKRPSGDR
jgi:hypothetical protein